MNKQKDKKNIKVIYAVERTVNDYEVTFDGYFSKEKDANVYVDDRDEICQFKLEHGRNCNGECTSYRIIKIMKLK